jgi:dTDP-4-amino-4,6-dideoxygalactose transaminase
VGNLGDVAVYSSEQSKVFNTIQGGIAATSDDAIAEGLRRYQQQASFPPDDASDRQLRNVLLNYYQRKHPRRWWLGDVAELLYGKHRVVSTTKEEERGEQPPGYGRRLSAPIAAIGLNQLRKLDAFNAQRRATARRWDDWCRSHGYGPPVVVADSEPVYLRYPVLVEPARKRETSWATRELGVRLGLWFVSHLHPSTIPVEGCPNASRAVAECVNFPCLLD